MILEQIAISRPIIILHYSNNILPPHPSISFSLIIQQFIQILTGHRRRRNNIPQHCQWHGGSSSILLPSLFQDHSPATSTQCVYPTDHPVGIDRDAYSRGGTCFFLRSGIDDGNGSIMSFVGRSTAAFGGSHYRFGDSRGWSAQYRYCHDQRTVLRTSRRHCLLNIAIHHQIILATATTSTISSIIIRTLHDRLHPRQHGIPQSLPHGNRRRVQNAPVASQHYDIDGESPNIPSGPYHQLFVIHRMRKDQTL
mmetsp:Transcript_2947/g.5386  ORF Transcript_2947/g.5386 Transcript_2947/m.5386 type:complete len:252 (+) Transcript_2947:63-818(+)